jgi:putative N6-adenine-specific DNA methylase
MANKDEHEIFLMAVPGLEPMLYAEVREGRYRAAKVVPGGVSVRGSMRDAWRANLELRGTGRVVVGIASFHADHLDVLAERARRIPWRAFLRSDVPVAVEATCRKSRIYHSGAAAQRVSDAIAARLGAPIDEAAGLVVRVRLEDDRCTIGIDTSGGLLHKRGHKAAVARAPMRETMAALLLRACGYDRREPVVDPMCGSGTFVIEAAEMALGLRPGRARSFAFEHLAGFDQAAWDEMRSRAPVPALPGGVHFFGSDRDAGAVEMSRANAAAAGVDGVAMFTRATISEIVPPAGPPGLVIVNPPYGGRIGDRGDLRALYAAFGATISKRFRGWRVGLVTNDQRLAAATGLDLTAPGAPISHGGLRVRLFQTNAL